MFVFFAQILSALFSKAVATGCVHDCLGITADMHDTRLTLIAFQNSKIAGKSSQYSMTVYTFIINVGNISSIQGV